jgi:beta-aspartyl-peptidase (threonine type)
VMERTKHVMLIGKGAEEFSQSLPKEVVETRRDDYFWTEKRWTQLIEVRKREEQLQRQQQEGTGMANFTPMQNVEVQLDHASEAGQDIMDHDEQKFGTVGCVALYIPVEKERETEFDNPLIRPQLASATSTGGMTNQRFNRVGDTPIIGAGTYANHLCAISCTGHGEHFIRNVAAHDIAKRLEYKHGYGSEEGKKDGSALQKAVEEVIFGTLIGNGIDKGSGGVIAIDRDGNFTAEMNCPGMYHGWIYEDGEMKTRIFQDERSHKEP